MPNPTKPTDLIDHLGDILYPIQAYAEVLQKSDVDHSSLAGYVLDSLCHDAETKLEKLTDALEQHCGTLAVKNTVVPEVVRKGNA